MALTEQEYLNWLKHPHKERCLLVVLDGYNLTTDLIETFYLSNMSYQTSPTDTPPNIAFNPCLKGDPFFSHSIPFYTPRGDTDIGNIEIDNVDASFDSWLSYSFAGRSVKIYMYDATASFDDFSTFPIIDGVVDDVEFENTETINVKIKNWMYKIDKPIQEILLTSPSPSENEPYPICYGLTRNISPVLIDPNEKGGRYTVNNGQIDDILNIYDNGVLLSPPSASYIKYNSLGEFVLKKRPVGTVTADIQGIYNTTWLTSIANIIEHIVLNFGELTASEIENTSFSDFDTDRPYTVGIYIKERQNILDILDELLNSVGGYYVGSRDGKLRIGYIKDPSLNTPVAYFGGVGNDLIIDNSISIKKLNEVEWRTTLGYQRNWTVQTADQLAGSINDPDFADKEKVAWLGKQSLTVTIETVAVKTKYLNSIEPEKYETLLDIEVDAQTEADYRHLILSAQRRMVTFTVFTTPLQLNAGDVVYIEYDRFNLARNIQILQMKDYYTLGLVEISGWF